MKSILISIKPKWVAKILNGEKTIVIRKTMPKCDLPIDVYIYCTKDKERLVDLRDDNFYFGGSERLNGKVIAKFTLNKLEEIKLVNVNDYSCDTYEYVTQTLDETDILEKSCFKPLELNKYLQDKLGYAWHISNLEIFNEPKNLCDFWNTKKGVFCCPLTKAPQSWCYVEVE